MNKVKKSAQFLTATGLCFLILIMPIIGICNLPQSSSLGLSSGSGGQPNVKYVPSPRTGDSNLASFILNVPLISQLPELPTGCEATAVTMMLQYKGINITKTGVVSVMPIASEDDPNTGFVGDPYTSTGYTIYPPALMGLVKQFAGSAADLTGTSEAAIKTAISQNKPVVVWITGMHGFTIHCVTITGYDKNGLYFNDPWSNEKNVWISYSDFQTKWDALGDKAISY